MYFIAFSLVLVKWVVLFDFIPIKKSITESNVIRLDYALIQDHWTLLQIFKLTNIKSDLVSTFNSLLKKNLYLFYLAILDVPT